MLVPLFFLLVFFFYPLTSIFERSFVQDGQLALGAFRDLAQSDYYRETLWFTTWQAALSTALTLGLAIPGAHVFARYEFPAKRMILALATLPFVLPTVVVAAAFIALFGPNSTLNTALMAVLGRETPPLALRNTLTIILLAHVFYNYAVALRIISSYWANQHPRIEQAAQVLGATPARVFWHITLPLLSPAIAAAGALVFVFTFTSFGVVLLLGGVQYATLEVEIYQQTTAFLDLGTAGALSVVQLLATLAMMVVYTSIQRGVTRRGSGSIGRAQTRRPQRFGEWVWLGLNLLLIALLIFAPLVALVERSFLVGVSQPTTLYYESLSETSRNSILFVPPEAAIYNSLRYAVIAMTAALILGTLAAYLLNRRGRLSAWLDPLIMLPLATSAVTLGFGFLIALDGQGAVHDALRGLLNTDESPLNLRDSFWIVPIAHTLVAMPFVVRSVLPTLRRIDPTIKEAAAVLGASAWGRWWRIELPLISRSLLVGATFAFTISMGEFGAAVFIARFDEPTMPIVIARLLGQPGVANYGQALAMSVLLMLVCMAGFLLIERLNRDVVGEF
ncbi:MAG: ABC transporter permease, partial [Anaerolineales bacterium]